jgi:hypothetical protein
MINFEQGQNITIYESIFKNIDFLPIETIINLKLNLISNSEILYFMIINTEFNTINYIGII